MLIIKCDNCGREIPDFCYPVRFYIVKFDFCHECFTINLDSLLKNRAIMKAENNLPKINSKKQGKEVFK